MNEGPFDNSPSGRALRALSPHSSAGDSKFAAPAEEIRMNVSLCMMSEACQLHRFRV